MSMLCWMVSFSSYFMIEINSYMCVGVHSGNLLYVLCCLIKVGIFFYFPYLIKALLTVVIYQKKYVSFLKYY
jgi:hypothetical protein